MLQRTLKPDPYEKFIIWNSFMMADEKSSRINISIRSKGLREKTFLWRFRIATKENYVHQNTKLFTIHQKLNQGWFGWAILSRPISNYATKLGMNSHFISILEITFDLPFVAKLIVKFNFVPFMFFSSSHNFMAWFASLLLATS